MSLLLQRLETWCKHRFSGLVDWKLSAFNANALEVLLFEVCLFQLANLIAQISYHNLGRRLFRRLRRHCEISDRLTGC